MPRGAPEQFTHAAGKRRRKFERMQRIAADRVGSGSRIIGRHSVPNVWKEALYNHRGLSEAHLGYVKRDDRINTTRPRRHSRARLDHDQDHGKHAQANTGTRAANFDHTENIPVRFRSGEYPTTPSRCATAHAPNLVRPWPHQGRSPAQNPAQHPKRGYPSASWLSHSFYCWEHHWL